MPIETSSDISGIHLQITHARCTALWNRPTVFDSLRAIRRDEQKDM